MTQYGTSVLVFESANRLTYESEPLAYQLLPGIIRVAADFGFEDYPYRFDGDALVITFPENGLSITYRKGGQAQARARAAVPRPGAATAGDAALMQHFGGNGWNATRNTETTVRLSPDGKFYENYSASYAEASHAPSWVIARDDNSSGRWTVQGNRQQGVITLIYKNGNRSTLQYRGHVERGQTYWNEYFFNGTLYSKNAKP